MQKGIGVVADEETSVHNVNSTSRRYTIVEITTSTCVLTNQEVPFIAGMKINLYTHGESVGVLVTNSLYKLLTSPHTNTSTSLKKD